MYFMQVILFLMCIDIILATLYNKVVNSVGKNKTKTFAINQGPVGPQGEKGPKGDQGEVVS